MAPGVGELSLNIVSHALPELGEAFRRGHTCFGPGQVATLAQLNDGNGVSTVTAGQSDFAVTVSDGTVVSVTEKQFNFLVANTPHFATELLRLVVERLRRTYAA